jgi:hypothetical protein
MEKMKRTACTFLFLTACLTTSTQAVTWSFDFMSLDGVIVEWGPESPPIATGAVEYDYQWELTQVDIEIWVGEYPILIIPILSNLPAGVQTGSGTSSILPFLEGPISIADTGIYADLFLGALGDGQGTGVLTNISLGTIGMYDVSGIHLAGDFTVTPVPEPP